MEENYTIIDPLHVISKKKMVHLKKWCRENKFVMKEFLEKIVYPGNIDQRYTFVEKNYNAKENCYEIILMEERPLSKHQNFLKRLQDIREANKTAQSRETKMNDVFRLYRQIMSLDPIKKLSKDVTDMALPSPTQIIQNKGMYEQQVDKIPDSILKTYFEKCIDIS